MKKNNKLTSKKSVIFKLFLTIAFFMIFFNEQALGAVEIPKIISRLDWGADESKMTWPAENAKVQKFVIHHTASTNLVPDSDGSGEYKNMVNNIYNYHSGSKTWYDDNGEYLGFGDIGYNYLIDPNGNIYEGRSGGNGVIAGHVSGFNSGSIGISVIGRYQDYIDSENKPVASDPVTPAIKQSLVNLTGWLAANNNIKLNSITNFNGKNIDGLVGHKDLAPTICPGEELYKQLSTIQNNASIIENAYNNYAYQINGDSAIYIISDGHKIRFESKEQLPNSYKNRTVKQISQSQLDAYKYKTLITYPNGSLLQEFEKNMVFLLQNGQKRAMEMSGEEFIKMGFATKDIIKVFSSDLKIYQAGLNVKYAPDGKLIKDNKGTVYLTENGKKKQFTSSALFEYLGYQWKNIEDSKLTAFYLDGSKMIYPNGILAKSNKKDTTYLIENKQKRNISSDTLLQILGYKSKNIISINDDELANFPQGKKLSYPDNTLVKATDSPAVYIVQDAKRKEFTSAVLFEKSGYDWKNIISIERGELNSYPQNGKVLYPDGLLIKSVDSPTVYLLESKKRREITSENLLKILGYAWNDIISVDPVEMKDYQVGKEMVYPDGTLIQRAGFPIIFRIENGKRKEFTSQDLFEAINSKISDIQTLEREEFLLYKNGGYVHYPDNTLIREVGNDGVYIIKKGEIQKIKSLEEFQTAGYQWSKVIDISKTEMNLYRTVVKTLPIATPEEIEQPAETKQDIETRDPQIEPETEDEFPSGEEPIIRVAIYPTKSENVVVSANGNYTVSYFNSNGKIIKTERKAENEKTVVPYFNLTNYVKFIPDSRDVILEIFSYEDRPLWKPSLNDNKFRGNIEVKYSKTSEQLWVINELPLEDYVNGIAEADNDSPEEYLKAFGTIARTYAMYYIEKGGKHEGEPFQLKNSTPTDGIIPPNGNDQVYKGYNFEMRAPNIIATNKLTAGFVIDYNDKPIVAAYSSDTGGVSKNACDVLSKTYCDANFAYLHGGVKDPATTIHDES